MAHSDQRFIIGVDLGGTNIVVGAMPDDGTRHYGLRSQPTMAAATSSSDCAMFDEAERRPDMNRGARQRVDA